MREKLIQIRCDEFELQRIRLNAERAGLEVSPFLRELGLNNVADDAPLAKPETAPESAELKDAPPAEEKVLTDSERHNSFALLVTQLEAQGSSPQEANVAARKRLSTQPR